MAVYLPKVEIFEVAINRSISGGINIAKECQVALIQDS